ncbi:hypothetical protein TNCV_3453401 [Trichonephila clavipes]|nr:hypothetical protein TNCV_3453401 [Trichonephila clavipes]
METGCLRNGKSAGRLRSEETVDSVRQFFLGVSSSLQANFHHNLLKGYLEKYYEKRENAMANAFWVSVRNNISKRWNTTENDVSKNQSSADSAIRLPNTSILNSNAADITEYFLDVLNCIILNIL